LRVAASVIKATTLSLTVLLSLTTAPHVHAQQTVTPEEAEVRVATVELDGAELFRVRGVSSLRADVRAQRIHDQIVRVAADPSISVDSLRMIDENGVIRIVAGDLPLMGVVDADAALEQVERAALATANVDRLRRAITEYRRARSPAALRASGIRALAATAVFALLLLVLVWASRYLNRAMTRRLAARIQSVEVQSFQLVRAEQVWQLLQNVLLAIKTIVLLSLVLLYVGFVLAQFPWTRSLSRDMVAFALVPVRILGGGLVASIPSLVFLAVLFVIVRLALRIIRLFFDAVRERTVTMANFDPEWADPTYKIVRLAVIAFTLVVGYPYIPGSSTAAFQGITVFIGIVFSLGSSAAIGNIIAGYMMTYRRALKVGDRVKIGDTVGDVIDTRLQVTHLRSLKNEEIIIPNAQIMNGEVLNYSSLAHDKGLILHTEVGIGYETPWHQVEAMLLTAAERTEGLSKDPRPFVLEKRLGDFAVTYELNAYCHDVKAMMPLYAAMHRNILDVFNACGVQIMTPAYEGDPSEPKVAPPETWHAPPQLPRTAVG
jgi:small-conductance mechanosensitive channel